MKTIRISLLAILVIAALALTQTVNAIGMADQGVGAITPTVIPPSGMDNTYLVNMVNTYNANGGPVTISGTTYTPMGGTNTPAPPNLPVPLAANFGNEVSLPMPGPTSFNIDLGAGGFLYLIVQWDGPNGVDAVYYIGGLANTITVTNTEFLNGNQQPYGASGYWLSGGGSVPDGGSTVLLLGVALIGIALVRGRMFRGEKA